MTLNIARGTDVVNACMCICGADGGGLGLCAGTRNAWSPAITIGCCATNDGSDRIAVSNCVVQTLQDDRVHSFGFDITISLDIERVAFTRGRRGSLHSTLVHVVLRAKVQVTCGNDGFGDFTCVQVPASHVDRDQATRARCVDGEAEK